MTVGWWGSAALESRIRTALPDPEAPFPAPKGKRMPPPTARWVWHDLVGLHGLDLPGQGRFVRHLPDAPQHRLQLRGKRYAGLYREKCTKITASVRNVG
jgi:hypothetical protein